MWGVSSWSSPFSIAMSTHHCPVHDDIPIVLSQDRGELIVRPSTCERSSMLRCGSGRTGESSHECSCGSPGEAQTNSTFVSWQSTIQNWPANASDEKLMPIDKPWTTSHTMQTRQRSTTSGRSKTSQLVFFFFSSVLPTCLPESQKSGDLPPQTQSCHLQPLSLEGHDCAKKKRSCSKKTSSTFKRKPACSLRTGSQQALCPHEELKHLPTLYVGLPTLHGLILRHRLKELILLFSSPCHLQATPPQSHGHVYPFPRFRRRHSFVLVDALLNQRQAVPECNPEAEAESPLRDPP